MFRCIPARMVLIILSFFGFINLYLIRFNFSVISVAMITPYEQQHSRVNETCELTQNCSSSYSFDYNKTTLDWDEPTRALVLGIFNHGYCLTQILGGRLAELYGTKYIFGAAVTLPSVLSFFIPAAAKSSYWGVVVIRFLQGVIQGPSWPSMFALVAHWIPSDERSRYAGIVMLGSTFGMTFIFPLSGFLCDTYSWETACYITGVLPLIWGVLWFSLMYEKPSLHPRISRAERAYIEKSVTEGGTRNMKRRPIPWKSIATSLPFIGIVVCDIGSSYGLAIHSSQMPNFLANVFHYTMTKTGIISGLPYFFRYCGSCTFTCLADYIISRKILKVATTRRISSAVAMFGPSVMLLFIILFGLTNQTAFVYLICTAQFLSGSIAASQVINSVDIAPNYAGTLFGITNTFASSATFLFLLISGEILNDEPTLEQWKIMFGMCIPAMVVTEVFYLVFLSGVPQPWNFYGEEKHSKMLEIPAEEESGSDNNEET